MKKNLFAFILLLSTTASAQKKFSTYIGLGMGGVIENKNTIQDCTAKGSPRVGAFISQYYQLNKKLAIGLQLIAGGDLIPTGKCTYYVASENTSYIAPNSLGASNILLKGRYKFNADKKINPYIDLGFGVSTYSYGSITQEQGNISKSSFVVSAEIGVEAFNRGTLSIIGIFGGNTPSSSWLDGFSAQKKVLQSISSQQVYLTIGYKLFQF
jgi:Outer membrane protein beta-barrel domain